MSRSKVEPQVDHLLVDRLWEMYRVDWFDCLYADTTAKDLLQYPPQEEFVGDDPKRDDDAWNFGRVRFFEKLQKGLSLEPITVDNICNNGHIAPVPVLIDGHHRLAAHRIAKVQKIPTYYSGRVDLLNYLVGKTKQVPEYLCLSSDQKRVRG